MMFFILTSAHLLLIVLSSSGAIQSVQPPSSQRLSKLCRNLSTINHLSEFEELIKLLKQNATDPEHKEHSNQSNSTWRFRQDPLGLCLEDAQSIIDLEPIIGERRNICEKSHIDKIELYASKYPDLRATRKFFRKYMNQVSFNCKHNMLSALEFADEQLIDRADYDQVIPWAGPDANQTGRCDKPRCAAERAFTSMKTINELADAIDSETELSAGKAARVELEADAEPAKSPVFFISLPQGERAALERMRASCVRLRRIYQQTIMPIVRLVKLGADPPYEEYNQLCRYSPLVRRWFSITLICESALSLRLADGDYLRAIGKNPASLRGELIIVDEADAAAGSEADESRLLSDGFQCAIEDELWIAKYMPGRLSRLRTSVVRRFMRALNLNDLETNILFRSRVRDTFRVMYRLILLNMTLLVAGISILFQQS